MTDGIILFGIHLRYANVPREGHFDFSGIIDTDILIGVAFDIGEAKECLSKISRKGLPGVSVITWRQRTNVITGL